MDIIGDFNEILSSSVHSRFRDYPTGQCGMREFQNSVSKCELVDLAFVGPKFTWWNSQDENPIGKNLDRALVNGNWLSLFSLSFASFESSGISDHTRIWIQLQRRLEQKRKPFKFFNFLIDHPDFLPTVSRI